MGVGNKAKEVLKKRFTIELILVAPDLDKKIKIEINMSDYMTGGECHILSVICTFSTLPAQITLHSNHLSI